MRDDEYETLFEKDSSETMECKTTQVTMKSPAVAAAAAQYSSSSKPLSRTG